MSGFGDWAYWLVGIGVLVVNGTLVYLAWWALFADRSKGRRRCPKCWYDMAYAPPPGMRCPECGHTARKEQHFHRTHRRYALAAGAIVCSAAISLFVTERITDRGLTSMLPTRVLLWVLPLADVKNSAYTELMARMNTGRLSPSQWQSLMKRSARGDWWITPATDDWIRKYGDFISNVRPSITSEAEIEQPLLDIPPRIDVTTRDVWPRGMPITLLVQVRDWWPWGMECRIRATPIINDKAMDTITFYRTADSRYSRTPFSLNLPPLDDAAQEIAIDFQLERRRWGFDESGRLVWDEDLDHETGWEHVAQQTVTVATQVGDELAQLATPVNNEAMLQAMKQAFSEGVVRWRQGNSPVRFSVSVPATFIPEFADTAVGVHVDMIYDGQIARRLSMWWVAGSNLAIGRGFANRNYGFEVQQENLDLLREAQADDDRWQIRVRSDPQVALRAGAAANYWQGEFTVPLRLTVRQDIAPPRPWRVQR